MICQLGTEQCLAMDRLYSPLCLFRVWGLFSSTELVSYSALVPCLLRGRLLYEVIILGTPFSGQKLGIRIS